MEGFLTRGWEIIIPGCGGTSALSRGATLAACWRREPQPIGNHPVGLGFPQRAGRYQPEGSAFSSPGWWSCTDMDGFLIRGLEIILPGCGGTSSLARGATLATRSLHEPQPISNHPVGLGFPHPAGRYRPGGSAFSSVASWSCGDMEGILSGDGKLSSPGVARPRCWPEGQLSLREGSMSPSQSAVTQWGWGFHTLRSGIDPGDMCYRP